MVARKQHATVTHIVLHQYCKRTCKFVLFFYFNSEKSCGILPHYNLFSSEVRKALPPIGNLVFTAKIPCHLVLVLCYWKLVDNCPLEGVVVLHKSGSSAKQMCHVGTCYASLACHFSASTVGSSAHRSTLKQFGSSSIISGPNQALGMPRSSRRSRTTCNAHRHKRFTRSFLWQAPLHFTEH